MNEIEQLEKELKALRPKEPSAGFERRVEDALGHSARLAVRQLPEECDETAVPASRRTLFLIPSLFLFGTVALCTLFFSFPSSNTETAPGIPADKIDLSFPAVVQDSLTVVNDSPINGVTSEELSAMSEPGWEEPQAHEILINFFDEGIVERPGMTPARRYRYHFMDETIWRNPETNTFIRSSVPRQETILIGLEPF
jgi:hypothetical protein